MSREASPAFQFYPRDYLTDPNVMLMPPLARGCYTTLMFICWLEQSLPSDDATLRKLAGATPKEWQRVRDKVLGCFYQEGNTWRHKRLDREREVQEVRRQEGAEHGRKGAQARWGNARAMPEHKSQDARAMPVDGSASASASTSASATETPPPRVMHLGRQSAHRSHAFCGKVCVPAFLHDEFRRAMAGNPDDNGRALLDWYLATDTAWADRDVAEDAIKFWRARFKEWREPLVASERAVPDVNLAEVQAFIDRNAKNREAAQMPKMTIAGPKVMR